jgi:hypothetical protein
MGDFKDFSATLRRMARNPSRVQQRDARAAALQPLVETAKGILEANGNKETGAYIESLGVAEQDPQTSAAGPIAGKRHSSLGVLLEFGTAPHYQPNRGVMHPGAQAFPHMRPAFDATKGVVVATLGREIVGSIFNRRS